MFGMGFTEIFVIMVVAILFLGPDKLPGAMIDIAKFFKNAKSAIGSVKESLEQEMDATGIKAEALAYKKELLNAQAQLGKITNIPGTINSSLSNIADDLLDDTPDESKTKKAPKAEQEVTFKKKDKKIDNEEIVDV